MGRGRPPFVGGRPLPNPLSHPRTSLRGNRRFGLQEFLTDFFGDYRAGKFFRFRRGIAGRIVFFADKGLTSAAVICIIEESRFLAALETQSNRAHTALLRQTQGRKRLYPADSVGCRHCLPVAVASFRLRREQVFSPSERKEVMLMNLHDLVMAILLALNLVLEYIAQHKKG